MKEKGVLVIIAVAHQELRHSLRRLIGDCFDHMIFADDYKSLVDTLAVTSAGLIIAELSLPTDHAFNVLRAIRGDNVTVPMIAIGDYDEPEAYEEAQAMGATAFVLRTRLSDEILPAIEQTLTNARTQSGE